MSRENVEIVERGFAAFREGMERGDLVAWFDLDSVADDLEWIVDPPHWWGDQVYRGREGYLEFVDTWTEEFDEWSIELERLIDAGDDRVVALFQQSALGKGSGARVESHNALVYDLHQGRVIRIRVYIDPAEALEAVGLAE